MQTTLMALRHGLLFAVLIAAVYTDLSRGKIHNWCTLPGILLGVMLNAGLGGVFEGGLWGANLVSSLGALVVVLLVFLWPYLRGGIAAGDVKLMLAVGAIGGMHNFFIAYALLYSSLIGVAMALVMLVWKGRLRAGLKGTVRFLFSRRRLGVEGDGDESFGSGVVIPYGFAIAVGSIFAWYMVELPRAGGL